MATKKKEQMKEVVTEAQIADWKKEFGDIYRTHIGNIDVIWHKLRRKEYVKMMTKDYAEQGQARIFARQDNIVRSCVLAPADIDQYIEGLAGFSTSIADEIMTRSGFDLTDTEQL